MPLPARLTARPSTVVEFRDGSAAYVFISEDDKWRAPVSLDAVDPAYVDALLRLEDKRFYRHHGVDPLAVVRAVYLNLTRGRRVSGASTLTLQLVRVLEPRPRTFVSKLVESVRAAQLELRLSKHEVLTAYLQFAPYGRNFEGVETAALAYFGHRATHLTAAEICTLLAVPQDPGRRFPSRANAARLKAARDRIGEWLSAQGKLPQGTPKVSPEALLAEVHATPVPAAIRAFPRWAPHVARWLKAREPRAQRLRSTLDPGVQRLVQARLLAARDEAAREGIDHGLAVVVDHRRGEVVAAVGSFDFWAAGEGAQIPGFDRPRSPGSALKPFLYARAIDEGLAGPDQLMPDAPALFGTYAPRNFDGAFSGLVRLEDALSRSLNLPFVHLLRQVSVERFLADLRRAGVTHLRAEPGFYGLSAAVGGLEVTPAELAGLYTVFARRGEFTPLRWTLAEAAEPAVRVFSEEAVWLTQRALSLKDRPDFPSRRAATGAPAHVHWKTGTSFGHRDAWAVGSSLSHTAAVWMGNFDNRSSAALVGAQASGPLLFDLLEALEDRAQVPPPDAPPRGLVQVEVCAYSGHRPTEACPERRFTYARKSHVPSVPCPYHLRVDVDVRTGESLAPSCRAGRDYRASTFTVWPASLRRFLSDHHRALPEPPPLAEGCVPPGQVAAPRIVSPAPGQQALLLPGVPLDQQEIPLEAETDAAFGELSWFVNGAFVGKAAPHERAWWTPAPGVHEVLVTDPHGMSTRRRLEVRYRRQ